MSTALCLCGHPVEQHYRRYAGRVQRGQCKEPDCQCGRYESAADVTERDRVDAAITGVLLDRSPAVASVLEAARAWVAAVKGDPTPWADEEDWALIDAVRALDGSTLPPYAPAVPHAMAEYGAHRCPACRFLGQPDGHTGCGGELERVTVAILRGAR